MSDAAIGKIQRTGTWTNGCDVRGCLGNIAAPSLKQMCVFTWRRVWMSCKCANWIPAVKLNANRRVEGQLRGYDHFMNVVLENAKDELTGDELGQVVRFFPKQRDCDTFSCCAQFLVSLIAFVSIVASYRCCITTFRLSEGTRS